MHDITNSSLKQLQAELKPLYRRMTAYANTRDPNDVEFHRIRTDAAAAIELADIYLSPTAFPQRAPQPENMQPPETLGPSTTSDAPARPCVPTRMDADAAMATPSADGAVDASSGMQVNDDTIELGLRQEEWERLLEEPMEQTVDPATADHDLCLLYTSPSPRD